MTTGKSAKTNNCANNNSSENTTANNKNEQTHNKQRRTGSNNKNTKEHKQRDHELVLSESTTSALKFPTAFPCAATNQKSDFKKGQYFPEKLATSNF